MEIKSRFSDKLSKILFLEVDKNKLGKIFKKNIEEEIYMPIKSEDIINKVKSGEDMDNISVIYFVEAMFFVLGADEHFKYNKYYLDFIKSTPESIKFIKGKIFKAIDEKLYEDAYIMLKGLINVEESKENYEKLLMLCDKLRTLDSIYKSEEISVINKIKNVYSDYSLPYLYESLIKREENNFEAALFSINNYIALGGEETLEITDLKISLKSISDYEKGKELIYDDPKTALSYLLPLIDIIKEDGVLYYYIAIAYRILENYEKAIYYLNEALNIESNMPQVINELAINYASLGNYEKAIELLRKAFEATKSIEICTNIIMCYLNCGNIEGAKQHFKIAQKMDPKDEVVLELEEILKKV
ncbi:tetratricopeptide repeat protein [Clostridium sp. MSJ-11]|uniref:Tetratricopeptide repeat protein n=1 Tax=Clostridium mobile TaxID=2841512 RepID=A0ABS6EM65_9CLOT|nr:tetratricopeptide repeat protein [Clostridium mobile]MBU5485484.1 tetratricopeptide repeat protein [Clostridium mobile]